MDLNELKKLFENEYGKGSVDVFFAPYRVNLIGEHIDYNGGRVLPASLSLGIYGIKRDRDDPIIRLRSKDATNEVVVNLNEEIRKDGKAGWGNYPKGVIKKLVEKGYSVGGKDILYVGEIPWGIGLSSSAAIEVLTAFMLLYGHGEIDRIEIAKACKEVENNFVEVNCGIMDQFVVSMGKKNHAILLNTETLSYEYIPVNFGEHRLVIMNTKKQRNLNESKYNKRRKECEEALNEIKKTRPLPNLCAAKIDDLKTIKNEILKKRARHVITENERVKDAVTALRNRDFYKFGKLLLESHKSLKDNFEVTGFHLDTIVDLAIKQEGCLGARMTGAGFGGCAIAIVKSENLENFMSVVGKEYLRKTGLEPSFYVMTISDGVNFIGKL